MIDISDDKALQKYLIDKQIWKPNEHNMIRYCKGGVSGTVVFVQSPQKQMIIKQGLAQLKTKEKWLCDPNRMHIEYRSNQIYHKLVPDCAPKTYFYDERNDIYGREALPEDWRMWKEDLLEGMISFPIAKKVISALLKVHSACSNNKDIAREFANNQIFYSLRISPYLEFLIKNNPALKSYTEPLIKTLMNDKITLVHGDFSPKNILTDGENVSIVDYEVSHYGHPAFDLAFFSAHFILKAVKNKCYAPSYFNILKYMVNIYFDGCHYYDKEAIQNIYTRLLPLILLARVEGKSPVEYLTDVKDKQFIQSSAFEMIEGNLEHMDRAISVLEQKIHTSFPEFF